ncbi:hypothetical protein FNV43_RR19456 [Rhamnella rubrinervis]|uniref:Uncharacterized protein n=1 Tax=Rhamnella rubrinervis TaxID=2594499 RepID=A0A8K0DYT9_9ROSA|nr:hypothetical protein FNV43_RR19456 [Rhamnella rubrinervis]
METSTDNSSKVLQAWKVVVLADLNVDAPPLNRRQRLAIDESSQDKSTAMCIDNAVVEGEAKRVNKLGKCRSRYSKVDFSLDYGDDADGDLPAQGVPLVCDKEVSSLKTIGSTIKGSLAYEKVAEILLRPEAEIGSPELLSLVQIHHAQCLLLESSGDNNVDKELEPEGLITIAFNICNKPLNP